MTIEEAATILARMYFDAGPDEKVLQIHLFGIIYAEEIETMPLGEIVRRSGLPKSYAREISKGRQLARFVQVLPRT